MSRGKREGGMEIPRARLRLWWEWGRKTAKGILEEEGGCDGVMMTTMMMDQK